jgi:molybdopterin-binding protein
MAPRPAILCAEVTLRIEKGVEIVWVITTQSARRLKLKQGGKAHALIKGR